MNNVVLAVFDSDTKAREASRRLEALADADVIRLNASAFVTKTDKGAITVSDPYYPMPESTLGATAVGVLIGMLAGGVGAAVGAAAGLVVGGMADTFYVKLGRDFLRDVERTLTAGKTALVAQVYEEDTDAIEQRIGDLQGTVFRRSLGELADDEYETLKTNLRRHSAAK
jgi:uncharacterized membrane protein